MQYETGEVLKLLEKSAQMSEWDNYSIAFSPTAKTKEKANYLQLVHHYGLIKANLNKAKLKIDISELQKVFSQRNSEVKEVFFSSSDCNFPQFADYFFQGPLEASENKVLVLIADSMFNSIKDALRIVIGANATVSADFIREANKACQAAAKATQGGKCDVSQFESAMSKD